MWPPARWFDHLLERAGRAPIAEDVYEDVVAEPLASRMAAARQSTGQRESVVITRGRLARHDIVCGIFDFRFLGGTLGVAAGERVVRALCNGAKSSGVVFVTATGGTRVQQGQDSFLQMTRVMAARQALAKARRPLIVVATDPTMGGVAASLAGAADILIAEPRARLAMSGPRAARAMGARPAVDTAIEALAGGVVDMVVPRARLRATLARLLNVLAPLPRVR